MRGGAVVLAALLPALAFPGTADGRPADRREHFPRPAALEPQVRFWRAIFAERSIHEVVVHDALHLDRIYVVLDFRPHLEKGMGLAAVERLSRVETARTIARVRATLLRLHAHRPGSRPLTAEERRIRALFPDGPPDRFRAAAQATRLRSQRGLRERFAEGVRAFHRYRPEMERIFREQGLPVELTRLPLIESSFNLHARSTAGAAGIWQFTRTTGRLFLRVDDLVDERRDPIASTRAAARYLHDLHTRLGTWPLAVTAYNHGPGGVARAVRQTGTRDIGTIVRRYRGPAFGFASRNFYAELLAALDVERAAAAHFGGQEPEPPHRFRERRLEAAVALDAAARAAGVEREELVRLNPALGRAVVAGRRHIPAGYRLRLPEAAADEGEGWTVVAGRSEAAEEPAAPAMRVYRVRRGDTLTRIARRHGVSIADLRRANRLPRDGIIRIGERLRIPVPAPSA